MPEEREVTSLKQAKTARASAAPKIAINRQARAVSSEAIAELPPVESTARMQPRIDVNIRDGVAFALSDCHFHPDEPATTAWRAAVLLAKQLKPQLIVAAGDICDFPGISKHNRILWEQRPKVVDEIAIAQQRLREVSKAAPKAQLLWTFGNHCSRLATFLSNKTPELEGLHGTQLQDFFPDWSFCWQVRVNQGSDSPAYIAHRLTGGVHAAYRNAVRAGATYVTGHTHSQKIVPVTSFRGTVWGVDCGCIADPASVLFENYTEAGPTDWRSGFPILTWSNGELMPPELVQVVKQSGIPGAGAVWLRGKLIKV
jgi:hypothetical protein